MSHAEVVRKRTKIEPTAQDVGLRLVIEVAAYDSGIVTVDGQPTSAKRPDQVWAAEAASLMVESLAEFTRQVQRRYEERG